MRSTNEGTRDYFNRIPGKWDALYSRKNRAAHLFNGLFRRGLYERHRLTFEHCGDIRGATVLDVGCGTGQYSIEFALRGASRVVGVDFAPSMIDYARQAAEKNGVYEQCRFICADFSQADFDEGFDIVLAVGFFDYVREPKQLLNKIRSLTQRTFLASFPSNGPLWRLQRTIRYNWIKKCPVYDYDSGLLRMLYNESGFSSFEIFAIRQGLFAVALKE